MMKRRKLIFKGVLCIALFGTTATLATRLHAASSELTRELINAGITLKGAVIDIRYAGENNFLGRPVQGYEAAECWLSQEATKALLTAQRLAEADGFALMIFDCYRPQRAVDDFVQWVGGDESEPTKTVYYPNISRKELIERGYIASRSGHSRGSTVDVSLFDAKSGEHADMGTPWDYFDKRSHTDNTQISKAASENRQTLKDIMERAGFRGYYAEWWHFTLQNEPFPNTYFDVPIE